MLIIAFFYATNLARSRQVAHLPCVSLIRESALATEYDGKVRVESGSGIRKWNHMEPFMEACEIMAKPLKTSHCALEAHPHC